MAKQVSFNVFPDSVTLAFTKREGELDKSEELVDFTLNIEQKVGGRKKITLSEQVPMWPGHKTIFQHAKFLISAPVCSHHLML